MPRYTWCYAHGCRGAKEPATWLRAKAARQRWHVLRECSKYVWASQGLCPTCGKTLPDMLAHCPYVLEGFHATQALSPLGSDHEDSGAMVQIVCRPQPCDRSGTLQKCTEVVGSHSCVRATTAHDPTSRSTSSSVPGQSALQAWPVWTKCSLKATSSILHMAVNPKGTRRRTQKSKKQTMPHENTGIARSTTRVGNKHSQNT